MEKKTLLSFTWKLAEDNSLVILYEPSEFHSGEKSKHTVSILVEQNPSFALEVAKDFLDLDQGQSISQDSASNITKSALL